MLNIFINAFWLIYSTKLIEELSQLICSQYHEEYEMKYSHCLGANNYIE
jgi:hypothetical protein